MIIASAQIDSKVGEIKENLRKHLEMVYLAAKNNVDLILFPELSITGYCREEGKELSLKESDPEIIELKEKANEYNLTIIVGAPMEIEGTLYIGSFILQPNDKTEIYTKQYLHDGEEEYYNSSFEYNPILNIEGEIFSFAICADINNRQHPIDARKNGCTTYLSSIFFTKNGIDEGHELLSKHAKENSFHVLMSNYSGKLWGLEPGGRSGFWDKNGRLVAELEGEKSGLLLVEKQGNSWVKKRSKKEVRKNP